MVHLEEMLIDVAVIRTTFETLDVFPDDPELRTQLRQIIADARGNLCGRLDRCGSHELNPGALPLNLGEFKQTLMQIAARGLPPRMFDTMMKVDVFEAVREAEASEGGEAAEGIYRYAFRPEHSLDRVAHLAAGEFTARVFEDLRATVSDEESYTSRLSFDRHVFRKFVAVMFAIYATTDPMFYGFEDT